MAIDRTLSPPRTWSTARLGASPASTADAPEVFAGYATDPEVARFMTWRPHSSLDDSLVFLRRCEQVWDDGSAYPWILRLRASGELAGLIEIRVNGNRIDLGYVLARRLWRQGLMSEALGWVVAWALAQPEIWRVWATCDVDNVASARTLERAGMEREGVLRRWLVHPNLAPEPRDVLCYAIVRR